MSQTALQEKLENTLKMAENICQFQEYMASQWKKNIAQYKTIFLYGVGHDAHYAVDFLGDILNDKEVYFIDSNPSRHGQEIIRGIRCYGIEKAYGYDSSTTVILITTTWYANEILTKLLGAPVEGTGQGERGILSEGYKMLGGIRVNADFIRFVYGYYNSCALPIDLLLSCKEKLLEVMELLTDDYSLDVFCQRILHQYGHMSCLHAVVTAPQYFPSFVKDRFTENEVFLDCGAFIGDSIEVFRMQTKDRFRAIYSFEMDKATYMRLQQSPATQDSRISLIPAGVSDTNRKIRYRVEGCPSYIGDVDNCEAHYADVVSIDSLVNDSTIKEKVTFVKMDIEGAEMDALRGMETMMREDKPKLAICVYHKWDDLWEIPLYIHSIVPEYKFSLRHHSDKDHCETVLYAYLDQ